MDEITLANASCALGVQKFKDIFVESRIDSSDDDDVPNISVKKRKKLRSLIGEIGNLGTPERIIPKIPDENPLKLLIELKEKFAETNEYVGEYCSSSIGCCSLLDPHQICYECFEKLLHHHTLAGLKIASESIFSIRHLMYKKFLEKSSDKLLRQLKESNDAMNLAIFSDDQLQVSTDYLWNFFPKGLAEYTNEVIYPEVMIRIIMNVYSSSYEEAKKKLKLG